MDDPHNCTCCAYSLPAIMDEAQAIAYLRIEGVTNPGATLKRYRDMGLLRAVRISRYVRYPKVELDSFVQKLAERQNRR